MKPSDYIKLEKEHNFKKSYFNNTPWWKTLLIVPPICFLFVGLVGIIYLFKSDLLLSWYIAPYIVLFTIGTIWLKVIKKHILKASMVTEGAYRICLAAVLGDKDEYTYAAFVNSTRRHDQSYITNLTKDISLHNLLSKNKNAPFKKEAIFVHDEEIGVDIYVKAYSKKELTKRNGGWSLNEGYFPILYIDNKHVPIIKRKDLAEFKS